jgi:anti-sigma regulatory factor (Ser/Thr protein kinase)
MSRAEVRRGSASFGPVRLRLINCAGSVRRGRAFVHRLCLDAGLPDDLTHTAVLLTSEVVTNAFRHGGSDARLAVTAEPDSLLVEVGDDAVSGVQPRPRDPEALGGRGLAILADLASAWGSYATKRGKVVWFRLDRS